MDTDSEKQYTTKAQELLWARPERASQKAKVAIIGGHSHSFQAVQQAYTEVLKEGAGQVKVLLPDSLSRQLPAHDDIEFAPSTKGGSFAQSAVDTMTQLADWSDVVYLPGELSSNSETYLAMEAFAATTQTPFVIKDDATVIIANVNRQNSAIFVLDIKTLQHITRQLQLPLTVTFTSTNQQQKLAVTALAARLKAVIAFEHQANIVISEGGNVWLYPAQSLQSSRLAVLLGEFPAKPLEAIVASLRG